MLRFKHLHYGPLFTQGGKGRKGHYITKITVPQQGGARGVGGLDYPDPEEFDTTAGHPERVALIKEMHKVLMRQPAKHLSNPQYKKTIDNMLKEYDDVVQNGWPIDSTTDLYVDWQYIFTNPDMRKHISKPAKINAPKPKSGEPKEKVIMSDAEKEQLKSMFITKRANINGILSGLMRQYQGLKKSGSTTDNDPKMKKLHEKIKKYEAKWDYWDKRLLKLFPKYHTENLANKLKDCHDELEQYKKSNAFLSQQLVECQRKVKTMVEPKVEPVKEPEPIKDTIKVPKERLRADYKPPVISDLDVPIDIVAEMGKLDEMKKNIAPALSSYSIAELKAIAKREKIVGITGLKKKKLVQLIIDARMKKKQAPTPPPASVVVGPNVVTPVAVSNIDPLYKHTVLELKAMCRDMGITGYGHKSKDQIIASIKAKQQSGTGKKSKKKSGNIDFGI